MRLRLFRSGGFDEKRLRTIHEKQVEITGVDFAFPDLGRNEYVVLACVDDEHGNLRGALIAHKTVELIVITDDARVMRRLAREHRRLRGSLASLGFSDAHAFVYRPHLSRLRTFFQRLGFRPSNQAYIPMYAEVK